MNSVNSRELALKTAGLLSLAMLCGCTSSEKSGSGPKVQPYDAHGGMVHQGQMPGKSPDKSPVGARAVAVLDPASGSNVRGTVTFTQISDGVRVEAHLSGLAPGQHGFHIHENGDCSSADASSAGGHYNPTHMPHAGPEAVERHVGDFGNMTADASGNANYSLVFNSLAFEGANSIIGKAVIIHGSADDLKSQPSGNAGSRVACGVIRKQ